MVKHFGLQSPSLNGPTHPAIHTCTDVVFKYVTLTTNMFTSSYLNTQYIKKQKYTDADINYGGFGHLDLSEQMLEIGEVNNYGNLVN